MSREWRHSSSRDADRYRRSRSASGQRGHHHHPRSRSRSRSRSRGYSRAHDRRDHRGHRDHSSHRRSQDRWDDRSHSRGRWDAPARNRRSVSPRGRHKRYSRSPRYQRDNQHRPDSASAGDTRRPSTHSSSSPSHTATAAAGKASSSSSSFSSSSTLTAPTPQWVEKYPTLDTITFPPSVTSATLPKGVARLALSWRPRLANVFQKEGRILGKGTYGSVFLARDANSQRVALKRINMNNAKEGFPITALREIRLLEELQDSHIIRLRDVVPQSVLQPGPVYIVFEYMEHDLAGLLDEESIQLGPSAVKYYFHRLLLSLAHVHKQDVLHRDVKGSNLLISNMGDVKLADFGLARSKHSKGANLVTDTIKTWTEQCQGNEEDKTLVRDLTNRVVTLWYRAPELLLGSTQYTEKIDMWAAGCVFAELLTGGETLFPGKTELEQLERIYKICGSPTPDNWPGVSKLPWAEQFATRGAPFQRKLRQIFKSRCTAAAVDLLDKLLTLRPEDRPSAEEALRHPYFTTEPPAMLERKDHPQYRRHLHEYETKRRNKLKRQSRRRDDNEWDETLDFPPFSSVPPNLVEPLPLPFVSLRGKNRASSSSAAPSAAPPPSRTQQHQHQQPGLASSSSSSQPMSSASRSGVNVTIEPMETSPPRSAAPSKPSVARHLPPSPGHPGPSAPHPPWRPGVGRRPPYPPVRAPYAQVVPMRIIGRLPGSRPLLPFGVSRPSRLPMHAPQRPPPGSFPPRPAWRGPPGHVPVVHPAGYPWQQRPPHV